MHSANFELKKFCIYIEDLYFSSGPLAPSVTRAGILVSATQRDKLVYRLVASHSFTRRAKRKPRNSPFCKRKINQCETRPVTKFNGEPLQFHAKIRFARRRNASAKRILYYRSPSKEEMKQNHRYSFPSKMRKSFVYE